MSYQQPDSSVSDLESLVASLRSPPFNPFGNQQPLMASMSSRSEELGARPSIRPVSDARYDRDYNMLSNNAALQGSAWTASPIYQPNPAFSHTATSHHPFSASSIPHDVNQNQFQSYQSGQNYMSSYSPSNSLPSFQPQEPYPPIKQRLFSDSQGHGNAAMQSVAQPHMNREEGELSENEIALDKVAIGTEQTASSELSRDLQRRSSPAQNYSRVHNISGSATSESRLTGRDQLMGDNYNANHVRMYPSMETRQQTLKSNAPIHPSGFVSEEIKQDRLSTKHQNEDVNEKFKHKSSPAVSNTSITKEYLAEQRKRAKAFISRIHIEGYTYSDLASEGIDPDLLKGIYEELGLSPHSSKSTNNGSDISKLPTDSITSDLRHKASDNFSELSRASTVPRGTTQKQTLSSTFNQSKGAQTSHGPNVLRPTSIDAPNIDKTQPVAPRPTPPKTLPPVTDRKEYIARMMAAKTKKSDSKSKDAVSNSTAAKTTPEVVVSTSQLEPSPSTEKTAADKKRVQTELARLKIEALRKMRQTALPKATKNEMGQKNAELNAGLILETVPVITQPELPVDSNQTTILQPSAVGEIQQTSTQSSSMKDGDDGVVSLPVEASKSLPRIKKRPVASDFVQDEPIRSAKRPFGQERSSEASEGMIIEVSDDDSSADENDQTITPPKPFQSGALTPSNAAALKQKLLLLKANAAQKQSSVDQVAPSGQEERNLQRHEEKIDLMKRKIAEMELKRRAKAVSSRSSVTPATEKDPALSENFKSGVDALTTTTKQQSAQIPTKNLKQQSPIPEIQLSRNALIASNQTIEPSPNHFSSLPTWKQKRRAEIESGIPLLDASFTSTSARMAVLKAEMEKLEEEVRKSKQDKARLVDELESLGIDTEGIPHEELQAKKDEIYAAADLEQEMTLSNTPSATSTVAHVSQTETEVNGLVMEEANRVDVLTDNDPETRLPAETSVDDDSASSMSMSPSERGSSVDMATDTVVQDQVIGDNAESDSVDNQSDQPMIIDSDDHASTTSEQSANSIPATEVASEVQVATNDKLSVVSSPESDYIVVDPAPDNTEMIRSSRSEPLEQNTQQVQTPASLHDSSEAEPQSGTMIDTLADINDESGDEEDYEPPETFEQHRTTKDGNASVSPAVLDRTIEAAGNSTLEQGEQVVISNSANTVGTIAIPDPLRGSVSKTELFEAFEPFRSPLMMFKAYRYHPDYLQNVSGGFRSLTYTHNIDPNLPVCAFEAAGGSCNDQDCQGQHFRSMLVNDDKMLMQIGTANPGTTPAERSRWIEELKVLLRSLREQNTQDAILIVSEIVGLRRRFLNDNTKPFEAYPKTVYQARKLSFEAETSSRSGRRGSKKKM